MRRRGAVPGEDDGDRRGALPSPGERERGGTFWKCRLFGPSPEEPLAEETPASADAAEPRPPARPPATLEPGTGVELSGLKSRPDLNGKRGRVVSYVPDRERYHVVVLGTNEETYLRAANLEATPAAAEAVAAPAEPARARPPSPSERPRRRRRRPRRRRLRASPSKPPRCRGGGAPPPRLRRLKMTRRC